MPGVAAMPVIFTSVLVKPVTALLNVTANLIGVVVVGSVCPLACLRNAVGRSTQNAVLLAIWTAAGVVPFLIATVMLPYKPLIVSCCVSEGVPAAVNWNTPLVRKTLF